MTPLKMDRLLYSMAFVSISFSIVIWIMHICALTNAKLKLNTRQQCFIDLPLPGVSIIKPLVGLDKNLSRNLETFFQMDYPTYELLFCVQDPNDPALLVVRDLIKKYPSSDARLFVGGAWVGVNPKINNMQPAYEATKYQLILVSDSGIAMRSDTLLDMVNHMHHDVALVHQMPFVYSNTNQWPPSSSDHHGPGPKRYNNYTTTTTTINNNNKININNNNNKPSFQAIVERVYFGTAHARAYLTADLLNINCPTGMSALMRKCLLDEVGGIRAFGRYLAEDFFFAKSFTNRGWKISISSQPALQNSASSSDKLSTLNSRIQRWIKLRFAMVPQWTLLEPFSECMLLGLLTSLSASFLWALNPILIFSLHVLLWFLFDYKLICTIQDGPLNCNKIDYLLAWLVRECSALVIFLLALTDLKVTWRSRRFKLKWGGYAEEILDPKRAHQRPTHQHLNQSPKPINVHEHCYLIDEPITNRTPVVLTTPATKCNPKQMPDSTISNNDKINQQIYQYYIK